MDKSSTSEAGPATAGGGTGGGGGGGPGRSLLTKRESELQGLLAEERQRSHQRKTNYQALKGEHIRLQKDFLGLQNELKMLLEETKAITVKRDAEVATLRDTMEHKDLVIEGLKQELQVRDPAVIREQIASELKEPLRKLDRERQALDRDKERLVFEARISRQQVEHLEKELVDTVERTRLSYEAEINLVRKEKEELRTKFLELSQTPDAQKISSMAQENVRLRTRLSGFQATFEEAEDNYKKVHAKLESLVEEHDKAEVDHERGLEASRAIIGDLRTQVDTLQESLRCIERDRADDQVAVTRLRKQLDASGTDLKGSESRASEQKETLRQAFDKERLEFERERTRLLDEIKRMKSDKESQCSRIVDLERELATVAKEAILKVAAAREAEAQKAAPVQRQKSELEARVKELQDERRKFKEDMDQLRRQLENSLEQRLSIEKELLVARARVEVLTSSSENLDTLRRAHSSLHDALNKAKCEALEQSTINKELARQKDRSKEEYQRLKAALDEERKELTEFKVMSEKNLARLRTCLEEERAETRAKMAGLEEELSRRRREKDELKAKCRQCAVALERAEARLAAVELSTGQLREFGHAKDSTVSAEAHRTLKKQYKDLKRKQLELSSMLNNCSLEGSFCGPKKE